ncbi:ABC transporter ATP-binding protein [Kitasatospora sp. NPDC092039]|uniref:ABC transporter ATP-binding protein n=1 Tax=Kitasatospora sp. NPDC092039 TaxID=3364086 RepID=UPI0038000619
MLEIEGLEKRYGDRQILRGVDLQVRPGRILGLLGANGAGKSTLVGIAAGLRTPDAGTVRICGTDVHLHPAKAQARLGIAPQDLGIYPTLSVAENLKLFASLSGLGKREARARVEEVARLLDLTELLPRKAEVLSGGQKRRLHTGMAITHRPDVLFLDEPTVGADVQSRTGILDVVRDLAANGSAVVYTTHYMPELEQLGADIAVLHEGLITARGTIEEIVRDHGTSSVVLQFDGPAPQVSVPTWRVEGDTLVSDEAAANPGVEIARIMSGLGDAAGRLTGIDLRRPSLENAYVAITGAHAAEQTEVLDALPA